MEESKLAQLNLSQEEIKRFRKAFNDEKFRDLFRQYIDEISDPVNQSILEEEITQLEKERGCDVQFIKPTPGYVIKTSENGNTKAYINICSCENIDKLNSSPARENETNGISLCIPYSVSPVQTRYDKQNKPYHIYTVVVHPATLQYTDGNDAVKKILNDTAISAIEKSFSVQLDAINLRSSKRAHKGAINTTIIKKNSIHSNGTNHVNEETLDKYSQPKYKIKYRNEMDLQNCTNNKYSRINSLIPTQMIVEISLPLLKSIQNTRLDVTATSIHLQNDDPARYKLTIPLSYEIDEPSSSAKFDSDSHTLTLELNVRKKITAVEHTSVPESEKLVTEIHDKLVNLSTKETEVALSGPSKKPVENFLRTDIKYKLPTYFCNYHQNKLVFTFKVKNVSSSSFAYHIVEPRKGCVMKFSSLGTGYFPMYYSFCVMFTKEVLVPERPVNYTVQEENVFVYLNLEDGEVPLEYQVGPNPKELSKEYLNEPESIMVEINDKKPESLNVNVQVTEFNTEEVTVDLQVHKRTAKKPTPHTSNKPATRSISLNGVQIPSTDLETARQQFLKHIDLPSFSNCNNHHSEDDKHSQSEPEQSSRKLLSHTNHKESTSDVENRSWIVETKSSKRACRKRRALEKKSSKDNFVKFSTAEGKNDSVFAEEETKPVDIVSAYKYADMSSRGILKKNRSFSESSGDELFHVHDSSRSFSVDDINFSSDSCSTSANKKTVTFNDVISKKLYSSDISILEQRKRTKRRTQRKERRASESDTSEAECSETTKAKQETIRLYNESLLSENSETELTSVSESGETSDDQSDTQEQGTTKTQHIPCSKKNHKRRGKKSARKNASTAKHSFHGGDF